MSQASKTFNKGTGAGGSNTNKTGLGFETLADNEPNLYDKGFLRTDIGKGKTSFYLSKHYNDLNITVYYATKHGFKLLVKRLFNVEVYKEPDEAYLIHSIANNTYDVKILEKKNQNGPGSVEDKILAGPTIKRMYQMIFNDNVKISYAFCLSSYLKGNYTSKLPKYNHIHTIFGENDIQLFYGEDEQYFELLNNWVGI
jgi:hypothetical protein